MRHDIIDNSKIKLADVLKEKLSVSQSAHFAIGWFFLTGLKELKEEIEHLEKLEILIGSKTNEKTAEAILLSENYKEKVNDILEKNQHFSPYQVEKIIKTEAENLIERISCIEPTKENVEFITWFWEKLREEKIEIKIYPYETLHSKLYLLDFKDSRYGKGVGFVGSSNLSISGLTLNTELNVQVTGDGNYEELFGWFNEKWEKGIEFTEYAKESIGKSWVLINQLQLDEVTPFRIYLRTLHEIFAFQEKEEIKREKKYGEVTLYNYQIDAVVDAYHKLHNYNGVFIADVPGLGKTYMGSAILAHLEEDGERAIVICPPKLIEQWQDVLSDFGVGTVRVFSLGKLEDILNNEKLMERNIILIDEAHHFRNHETFRYNDLQLICENKKVILVGATPQNLSIWDLYWQIKLFIPNDLDHKFRIDPPDLKEFFSECDKGRADLEDLIAEIVVRRTRSNILKDYHENIHFPERKGPYRKEYDIDKVYPGGLYKKLSESIDNLKFARYDIASYLKERNPFTPDQLQRLKVAGKNLRRLMKIILFRRLESSIPAFRKTLNWMLNSYQIFLVALGKNVVLAGKEFEKLIDDIKAGEDIEGLEIPETDYKTEYFYKENLIEDIKCDRKILEEMFNSVKNLTAENDDKLKELISLLREEEIAGKKTIIFTQFSTTAEYLAKQLQENNFDKVDCVSGSTGKTLTKAKRFAPKANNYKVKSGEEINILVSTELLSEGLNLQDGQVVINYELHWNPVRIIQRIGRIDRIGSKHDEIYVYNFFPEEEVERNINVESKVKKRILEIVKRFGGDEKTISMDEETVEKKLFEIYTEQERAMEGDEIRSRAGYFSMEWLKLKEKYPEEYKKSLQLPKMVMCGMENKKAKNTVAVFCKSDDFYKLLLSDKNSEIINRNDWEILELIECLQNAKATLPLKFHLDILGKVRKNFEEELNRREIQKKKLEGIKRQTIARLDRIKRGKTEKFKREVAEVVRSVREIKLLVSQRRALRKEIRKYGALPEEIVSGIKEIVIKGEIEEKKLIEKKYAQIIISESFVEK